MGREAHTDDKKESRKEIKRKPKGDFLSTIHAERDLMLAHLCGCKGTAFFFFPRRARTITACGHMQEKNEKKCRNTQTDIRFGCYSRDFTDMEKHENSEIQTAYIRATCLTKSDKI